MVLPSTIVAIADARLVSPDAQDRLAAARAARGLARRGLAKRAKDWPGDSPGTVAPWLLLLTTKPPTWRDPFVTWRELPPTLGEPHEGFFYPDPLGFWAEVRRWATLLARAQQPTWSTPDALSVTTLLHMGDAPAERMAWARRTLEPAVMLFLDEAAWSESGLVDQTVDKVAHPIPDPHRPGKAYEGFWGRLGDGAVVGKAPQHPASHKLYSTKDLDGYLSAIPR